MPYRLTPSEQILGRFKILPRLPKSNRTSMYPTNIERTGLDFSFLPLLAANFLELKKSSEMTFLTDKQNVLLSVN